MELYKEYHSKVVSAQGAGTWEAHGKTFYTYDYAFEDGNVLRASHLTQNPFQAGATVSYQPTKENQFGFYGKVAKAEYGGDTDTDVQKRSPRKFDDNTRGIKIGHAINNAVILVSGVGCLEDMNHYDSIKEYAKMIYQISEELNNEIE